MLGILKFLFRKILVIGAQQKYQKKVKVLATVALVISLVTNLIGAPFLGLPEALAAPYTWTQTAWDATASSSVYASHNTDQTGWTKYEAKESGIDTTSTVGQISAATASSSWADTDFTGATAATTTISLGNTTLSKGSASWATSTVQTTDSVGQYSSIKAIDANTIFISYFDDAPNYDLKFAKSINGGTSWTTSTVDATGVVGYYTSIAALDANTIFISYYEYYCGDDGEGGCDASSYVRVKFAKSINGGTSWTTSTIQTIAGYSTSSGTSITVVDANTIFISYYTGDLVVAKSINGGTSWTTITVDSIGYVGYDSSITALDANTLFISYYDLTNTNLKFANSANGGTSWTLSTLDATGDVGQWTSIKALDTNTIFISYGDVTNIKLKFAKSTDGGTSWTTSTADATPNTGWGPTSITALDANTIFISHYRASVYDLKFAQSTNGGTNWTTSTLDSIGDVGLYSSIAALDASTIFISYYDGTNQDLKLAKYSAPYNSTGTLTSAIKDTTANAGFGTLTWSDDGVQTIAMRVRTGNQSNLSDATVWGSCNTVTKNADISSNNCVTDGQRYIQYQATLSTADTSQTPTLQDVTINYDQYPSSKVLTSSWYNTSSEAEVVGAVSWQEPTSLPSGTDVRLTMQTAPDNGASAPNTGSATGFFGPDGTTGTYWNSANTTAGGCSKSASGTPGVSNVSCNAIPAVFTGGSNDRWLTYKITLTSTGANTSTVYQAGIQYDINTAPTGAINSASELTNGTGKVNLSIEVDDGDDNDIKAKLEYKAGTSCASGTSDPTLDQTTGATADFNDSGGAPSVVNADTYQIGTTATNRIITSSGSNTVAFVWDSGTDVPTADGTYCVRLTVNDDTVDQTTPATTTLTLDNVAPSGLSSLNITSIKATTASFSWSAVSETNFNHYEIWYGTNQTDVQNRTGTASEWDNSDDANLATKALTSTTITGLSAGSTYYFKIWAVDNYGNEGTVATVSSATNTSPTGAFNSASQTTNGTGKVNLSIEVDDGDDNDIKAKLEYKAGTSCASGTSDPTLDQTTGATADFNDSGGAPSVVNADTYQIGTTATNRIITSSGSNTVAFVWDSGTDVPTADGTYCVRLTVNDDTVDQTTPATTTLTLDNVAPSGLSSLNITSIKATTASFSWSAVSETNFNHYEIWYGTNQTDVQNRTGTASEWDNSDDANLATKTLTSTTITGLSAGATYYFKIWALDNYGNEGTVTDTSGNTLALIPSNLTLTIDSSTQISASWQANGNPAGTEYYCNNLTAGTNSGWTTGTSWSSTNLLPGSSYSFEVKARNAALTQTNYSDAVNATTIGSLGIIVMIPPIQAPLPVVGTENMAPPNESGRENQGEEATRRSRQISELIQEAIDIIRWDVKVMIINFNSYGTPQTVKLGAGERAGVIDSYQNVFGQLPETKEDWEDVLKISLGRWPTQRSEIKEAQAEKVFQKIYQRAVDRRKPREDAAIIIIAYGLRSETRNLESEKAAIKIFNKIFHHLPATSQEWNDVRAIAYSGVKR